MNHKCFLLNSYFKLSILVLQTCLHSHWGSINHSSLYKHTEQWFADTHWNMHSCCHLKYWEPKTHTDPHTKNTQSLLHTGLVSSWRRSQLVTAESTSRVSDRSRWCCHACHRTASPRIHLWQLEHVRPVRAAPPLRLIITGGPASAADRWPRAAPSPYKVSKKVAETADKSAAALLLLLEHAGSEEERGPVTMATPSSRAAGRWHLLSHLANEALAPCRNLQLGGVGVWKPFSSAAALWLAKTGPGFTENKLMCLKYHK